MSDYWYTDSIGRKRHVGGSSEGKVISKTQGSINYPDTYLTHQDGKQRFKSYQDITRKTSCPICKDPVYFIRHNGGSVYVDELGWPWSKHPCFDNSSVSVPRWYNNFYKESKEKNKALIGVITKISSKVGILLLDIDFGEVGKGKIKIDKTMLADSIIGLLVLIKFTEKEIVFSTNFGTKKILSLKFEFENDESKNKYSFIKNF